MELDGLQALELALLGGVVIAWLIWRLGREIPPEPGADERTWREGWYTGLLPFGRQRLTPIGQREPKPRHQITNRRNTLAFLATLVIAALILALISCSNHEDASLPCFTVGWWLLATLTTAVLVGWISTDRWLKQKDPRARHHHRLE